MLMIDWLQAAPSANAKEAGDMLELALDGYLRTQDLELIRVADVIFYDGPPAYAAVRLGESRRGESTKTGRDQGVLFDDPSSIQLLRRRTKGKKPGDRVFSLSKGVYTQWYWRAAEKTKVKKWVRPPHSVRHTAASRDLHENYRTWQEIKRRGRWTTDTAVQRYAAAHAYLSVLAELPTEILNRGRVLRAARAPRPSQPLG